MANKISYLPDTICNLKKLKGLRLNKNKLNFLPADFGKLINLKELSLYKNNLKILPDSFDKLKLEKLNIAYNSFSTIPNVKASWLCVSEKDCFWEK